MIPLQISRRLHEKRNLGSSLTRFRLGLLSSRRLESLFLPLELACCASLARASPREDANASSGLEIWILACILSGNLGNTLLHACLESVSETLTRLGHESLVSGPASLPLLSHTRCMRAWVEEREIELPSSHGIHCRRLSCPHEPAITQMVTRDTFFCCLSCSLSR